MSLSARLSFSSADELARNWDTEAAIKLLQMPGRGESELLEFSEGSLLMLNRPEETENKFHLINVTTLRV